MIRPDITFYDEEVPRSFYERLEKDRTSATVDLVLVIGTSLAVQPVNQIISHFPPSAPRINILKTPISGFTFDISLRGHCACV